MPNCLHRAGWFRTTKWRGRSERRCRSNRESLRFARHRLAKSASSRCLGHKRPVPRYSMNSTRCFRHEQASHKEEGSPDHRRQLPQASDRHQTAHSHRSSAYRRGGERHSSTDGAATSFLSRSKAASMNARARPSPTSSAPCPRPFLSEFPSHPRRGRRGRFNQSSPDLIPTRGSSDPAA